MRTKVTLVLLFLNVALFAFIFYVRPRFLLPAEGKDRPGRILGPQAANIQKIEIGIENSGATVRLERRGTSWFLSEPIDWPANEFAVKRIINELQFLEQVTSFSARDLAKNGQTLADFGLEKPPLTLTFTAAPSAPGAPPPKPVVLKIGNAANVGNLLYVLSPDGDRVHVVNRSLMESVSVKLEALRADTLFTIPVFEARALAIQFFAPSESKARVERKELHWALEVPLHALANKESTELLVNGLDGLRIKRFLDSRASDPVPTGLDHAVLRLSLEGNNRIETLLVGAPVEALPAGSASPPSQIEYYGRLSSTTMPSDQSPIFTFALPNDLLATLRNAQEKLREHHILNFDSATVTTITLGAAGQPDLILQRLDTTPTNPSSAAWQIVRHAAEEGPKPIPADYAVAQKLLDRLAALTAEDFTKDDPDAAAEENYGFNRPVRQIQLTLQPPPAAAGGVPAPTTLTLKIGAAEPKSRSVYAKVDNCIYRVSAEILRDTPVSALHYRERVLRELPAGAQIVALKLIDLSNNSSVLLNTTLPLPASTPENSLTPIRRKAIETLAGPMGQLRVLRAKRFALDTFPETVRVAGEERPWKYQLDATLSLVGGSGTQTDVSTLFISERAGGTTQWVGSKEAQVVFEAEQPLLDAIFALTYASRDPGVTLPPPPPAPTVSPVAPAEALSGEPAK